MGRNRLDHHRFHVGLERSALARLDALVGPKGRAEFVWKAVDQMLDQVETAQAIAAKAAPKPKETAQCIGCQRLDGSTANRRMLCRNRLAIPLLS